MQLRDTFVANIMRRESALKDDGAGEGGIRAKRSILMVMITIMT